MKQRWPSWWCCNGNTEIIPQKKKKSNSNGQVTNFTIIDHLRWTDPLAKEKA